jgi:hypothetical protein
MTPDGLFQVFNLVALAGWVSLAAGIIFKRSMLRDTVANRTVPLIIAFAYAILILFFFGEAEGGFGSLSDVMKLFSSPWVVLAGWLHYLAFDLFIGSWIARDMAEKGFPRWPLFIILPFTFMLGPVGLLLHFITIRLLTPVQGDAQ